MAIMVLENDSALNSIEVATSLSDGSYFGEICLLTNARYKKNISNHYVYVYDVPKKSTLNFTVP